MASKIFNFGDDDRAADAAAGGVSAFEIAAPSFAAFDVSDLIERARAWRRFERRFAADRRPVIMRRACLPAMRQRPRVRAVRPAVRRSSRAAAGDKNSPGRSSGDDRPRPRRRFLPEFSLNVTVFPAVAMLSRVLAAAGLGGITQIRFTKDEGPKRFDPFRAFKFSGLSLPVCKTDGIGPFETLGAAKAHKASDERGRVSFAVMPSQHLKIKVCENGFSL